MGRNGSGKSSLLWAVQGSGPRLMGRVVTESRVGLVPQSPGDLLYLPTVRGRNCAEADSDAGAPSGTCAAILDRLVVDIAPDTHPRDLSEGQRLALALEIFAAIVGLMFLVWLPNQWDLDSRVDTDLTNQARIEGDLTDLVDAGAFEPLCGKIAVPNHRAVPRLAFGLDIKPTEIVSASENKDARYAYFVAPASQFVIHNFILDPNDPTDPSFPPPAGFKKVAGNESWIVYRRCP